MAEIACTKVLCIARLAGGNKMTTPVRMKEEFLPVGLDEIAN